MSRFILSRFLQAIVSLFVLVTVVFFLVRLTGDPATRMIPPQATEEVAENLRRAFGLDKPVMVQYGIFLREAAFGFDLGTSQKFIRPVTDLLKLRIGASLQLAVASMAVALFIALPLGIYSAVRRGSRFDYVARAFSIAGGSLPSFLVGLLMIRFFAVDLGWFPISGREEALSIVLPALTLGWFVSASFMRLTRSSMLEVLDSEFVKLARIKGVREASVIWKHALKNALLPVVTYSTVIFAAIVGGAIVIETVFAWPGIGKLLVDAVLQRDFPMIQGTVILIGAIFIVTNLLTDILYAFLNPKIRFAR